MSPRRSWRRTTRSRAEIAKDASDELIAVAATFGLGAPRDRRADRITVDGKTLRFADVDFAAAASEGRNLPALLGTLVVLLSPFLASKGIPVPSTEAQLALAGLIATFVLQSGVKSAEDAIRLRDAGAAARETLVNAAMLAQGAGAIVNVSSIYGLIPSEIGHAPYCTSKHGVIGLSKTAAIDYGQTGLRINVVAPGFTRSEMVNPDTPETAADDTPAETPAAPAE